MDESRHPLHVVGLPIEGPPGPHEPVPCDFVPLHLVLEGGTLAIELTAPDLVLTHYCALGNQPHLKLDPASAKNRFLRGAIALAVNGVPIFNPLNNRGDDAYLAGDSLFVRSPKHRMLRVPANSVPALRGQPRSVLLNFEIDPDGSFLYWPDLDVHPRLDSR